VISEGSCDTEDWSNDAKNSALILYIKIKLNLNNISQLNKINAALVSIRDILQKH